MGDSATPADLVVGTAGHIDHGKTALVRVLTGIDLDALPEEQERGITIALGFAPFDLPDGRRVAFVDVPGHERLVRTMVAGATGVDAVLLCVSAVDGVMPQTREHLAILELLGVHRGAVVLTMADLVDEELLELAAEDVRDVVAGTFLQDAPIVPFSAVTGRGREAVVSALARFDRQSRSVEGPFRLPVDRSFVRAGFGTIVTGTVWSGRVREGASLRLLPGDVAVRVRGIQVHNVPSAEARAGWRAALNLAGVDQDEVPRGTLVTDAPVPTPHVIDVRYRHLARAEPLRTGAPVRMLLGTAEALGRIHLAGDRDLARPGRAVFAQVRLDAPLPVLPGDRFVIRRPSPETTLGGGEVLDPWAPRMKRRDREVVARQLKRLAGGAVEVWLERAGEQGVPPADWAFRAPGSTRGVPLGDRVYAASVVGRLEGRLLEALRHYHEANPLALGAHRRELRRGRLGHLTDRVFDGLVDRLAETGAVVVKGPIVRLASFEIALSEAEAALSDRIVATLDAAGVGGIASQALHEAHPEPETAALVHLLDKRGAAVSIPLVGWVAATALDDLAARLRAWFLEHDRLSPGDFKELTGLSRRTAIPLLEWLDKQKWTRRTGDARAVGPDLPD